MKVEIQIQIKNDVKSLRKSIEPLTDVTLTSDDPIISKLINEAIKEFDGPVEDVIIRAKMTGI